MAAMTMDSYAKINLFLDIEGIRDDGYHNILSVMQSVSLCDTVTVEYTPSDEKNIEITCNRPDIPLGEKNIAYKAASRLVGSGNIRIHIEKRIPAAAGLAGGSADAAATLILLNKLACGKSEEELIRIGKGVGADVPFCMVGGTKLIDGIGDIAGDFPGMPDCHILIACGGEGVSTPWGYGELDRLNNGFVNYEPRRENLEVLKNTDNDICEWVKGLFNIFEDVVLPQRPIAARIKAKMLEGGAKAAMMSGSGPSVFGIFTDRGEAEKMLGALKKEGIDSHICTPK